jgi:hypothetical protein
MNITHTNTHIHINLDKYKETPQSRTERKKTSLERRVLELCCLVLPDIRGLQRALPF